MSHSHQITFLRSLSAEEQHQLEELCRPLGEAELQPLRTAPELHRLRLELGAAEDKQEQAERRRLLERLLPWARGRALPFYYPSSEARRPIRRVAFDLDGTLIRDELMVLLARQRGCGEEMQQLTEAAMCGARPFRESFVARSQLLLGLSEAELLRPLAQLSFAPDAAELIAQLQQRGLELCLISDRLSLTLDWSVHRCLSSRLEDTGPAWADYPRGAGGPRGIKAQDSYGAWSIALAWRLGKAPCTGCN